VPYGGVSFIVGADISLCGEAGALCEEEKGRGGGGGKRLERGR